MNEVIKISKKTQVNKAAGAVAHFLRDGEKVYVTGTGRLGMMKALQTVTLARRYVLEDGGFEINVRPDFMSVQYGEDTLKGIQFFVTACNIVD